MALTSATRKVSYTGNASTKAFAFGYLFFADADLVVKVDDVTKTLTTDYTVTGAGEPAGGTVTFGTAPADGAAITIERTVAFTQPTSLRTQGNYSPKVHENALDKGVMQAQQLDARVTTAQADADALDVRLTTAEADIDAVEARASDLEAANLDPRTTSLETRATSLETRTTAVESKNTTQDASLVDLDTRLGNLELESQFSTVTHTGGTGPEMVVTGVAPASSVHVWEVEAITPGDVTSSIPMHWREDGGAWQTGLSSSLTPVQLGSTGVYVSWPAGGSIGSGDLYRFTSNGIPATVVRTNAASVISAPSTTSQEVAAVEATAGDCTTLSGTAGAGFRGTGGDAPVGSGTGGPGLHGVGGNGQTKGPGVRGDGLDAGTGAGEHGGVGGRFTGGAPGTGDGSVGGVGVHAIPGDGAQAVLADGSVESTVGGFIFPDNTTQTSSASARATVTRTYATSLVNGSTDFGDYAEKDIAGRVAIRITVTALAAGTAAGDTLVTLGFKPDTRDWRTVGFKLSGGTETIVSVTIDSATGALSCEAALASGDSLTVTTVYQGA